MPTGKKPATQKSCNVEVCSYDYPNGHQHFEEEKEEKDLEEQGKPNCLRLNWAQSYK